MTKSEYTKADLVEYIYRRSNATKKVLTSATVEQLEALITKWDKWNDFYNCLPNIIEFRTLNNYVNAMFKEIKNRK